MNWTTDNILDYQMPLALGYVLDTMFACIIITGFIVNIFWVVFLSTKAYTCYKIQLRIEVSGTDPEEQHRKWGYRVNTWKFGLLAVIATLEIMAEALFLVERNSALYIQKQNIFPPSISENCTTDTETILLYESAWKISYIYTLPVITILSFISMISFLSIFLFKAYSKEVWEFERERRTFKLIIVQIVVVSLICFIPYTFSLGILLGLTCTLLHTIIFIKYTIKLYNCLKRKLYHYNDKHDRELYSIYKKQSAALRQFKILSWIIQPAIIAFLILFILAHLLTLSHLLNYSLCRSEIPHLKISNEQLQATRSFEGQLQLVVGMCILFISTWIFIGYTAFTVYFIIKYLRENRWKKRCYRYKPYYSMGISESNLKKQFLYRC